jgi:HK97 family phage prohead protease
MDVFDCEFKLGDIDVKSGSFRGYGSVYSIRDLQDDVVMPGSFKRTLEARKSDPIPLLWSHNTSEPIGVSTAQEDAYGLAVAGELVLSVPRAAQLRDLMKVGAVRGLSIGYRVPPGGSKMRGEVRELHDIDLVELSLCVLPACPVAQVTSPPKAAAEMTPSEWERHFRGAGFSKAETERLVWSVKQGFKSDVVDDTGIDEALQYLRSRKKQAEAEAKAKAQAEYYAQLEYGSRRRFPLGGKL